MLVRKTPLNSARSPAPAWWSLPCAATLLHVPSALGTTSVNGIVEELTLSPLEQLKMLWPLSGLKFRTGKDWVNAAVSVAVPYDVPGKKRPSMTPKAGLVGS